MARPKKDGLSYFSLDTDFFYADRKIKALRSRYGSDGLLFYIYLLTEIYRNGYYIRWDEDSMDNAIADLGLTEGLIEQIMTFLVSRSLLTKSTLANSDTIITSPGIQKRYQEAVKSLKRDIYVDSEIWLLNKEETAICIKCTQNHSFSENNDNKSEKNACKSEKNDTKEIKRKEIKQKESKENDYQLIADMYNDICVSFPRLTTLSDARKKAIGARLKYYSTDDFRRLFEMAERSNFLKGKNQRNWSATFDWLIKDANMAKVLDGNYENKETPTGSNGGFNGLTDDFFT